MKRIFLVLTLCLTPLMAADNTSSQAPANSTAANSPGKAGAPNFAVPAGAQSNGDGSFSYTDEHGKKWIYRSTPLGVVRVSADEAHAAAAAAAASAASPGEQTKVTDLGDSVRFEVPWPFGVRTVVKKKADLSPEEKDFVAKRLADEAARKAETKTGSHE